MISAIAFRKAQAAQNTSTSQQKPSKQTIHSPPKPAAKPPSKRKSSAQTIQNSESPAKKKRKNTSRPPKPSATRYFTEQLFNHNADVIIVDSDSEDENEDEALSEALEDLVVEDDDVIPQQRPWSPSAPAEKEEEYKQEDTTFVCVPQQNVFYLTAEEIGRLPAQSQTATAVILTPSDKLCMLGSFLLTVVQGSVSLYGTTLDASRTSHKVYAPRSSPLPVIQLVEGAHQSTSDASSTLPARLQHLSKHNGTIVIIQDLDGGIRSLSQICKTFHGIFEPRDAPNEDQLRILGVSQVVQPTKDIQIFNLPESWNAALQDIAAAESVSESIHLVKGAKKSGKSTFARTLVNRMLRRYRRVAYMECDLGQSEFTPGGMVALNIVAEPLLGPPFTHPALPTAGHYIGATSPKSSPSLYLSAIQALIQTYRLDIQTPLPDDDGIDDDRINEFIPLVVNSMGWAKGLGGDLVRKIEEMLAPTHIYHFEAPTNDYDFYSTPSHAKESSTNDKTIRHNLEPITISLTTTFFTPADQRNMSIMSYFYAIFPSPPEQRIGFGSIDLRQHTATGWNPALPLSSQPPFEVDWTVAFDQITLVGAGMEDVVSSEIRGVLNGALVGLVACSPGSVAKLSSASSDLPYEQSAPAPSPLTSCCIGLAFIRAVSPGSPHFQLLTPAPVTADTRVLVKGEMEMPIWAWLNPSHFSTKPRTDTPYLQWGKGEGIGSEKRRVRRNLMRKAQM